MVDSRKAKAVTSDIRKRTPLEKAIAEQTDRRRKHDAKMERQGLKRTTFWVRPEALAEIRAFISQVNARALGEGHD